MAKKRYSLPKRFNAALSEKAYAKLRALNAEYNYGNNYLLTILLENFETVTNPEEVRRVFAEFEKEYGAPAPGSTGKTS